MEDIRITRSAARLAAIPAAALLLSLSCAFADGQGRDGEDGRVNQVYSFALTGDFPYGAAQESMWLAVRDHINADRTVDFTIFDGDIKSGSTRCTDSLFQVRYGQFNTFRNPFVYIFGDNEWTDCHRANNGAYDPLERLDKLRQIFTQGDRSLGERTIQLTRQSATPGYEKFRENVRASRGPVLFVGLNIPGSNNNFGRTPSADAEYVERNAANLAFLREAFSTAKIGGKRGIMIVIQANPGFELPPTDPNRTGFNDFLALLQSETLAFDGQVVLVHGDSHFFRIDKPMITAPGLPSVTNFTRVETFGSPNIHWVRVTVHPKDANVFRFEQRIVPGN